MQLDTYAVKKHLEAEFDIPFEVSEAIENGETTLYLYPENRGKELFRIKISFKNNIRLNMDFIPERYSANFISSMGRHNIEDRIRFTYFLKLLERKGMRCKVCVNDIDLDISHPDKWPDDWNSFTAHLTKMPVNGLDEHNSNYTEIVIDLGTLMMGMILSLTDIVPLEDIPQIGYSEGNSKRIEINRYERNPLNRSLCLVANGYNCKICGFNFEQFYGEIGRNYIHVHHIVPVSELGEGYIINPVKDLIPVCPNCHAMLHRFSPPLLPDKLIDIIKSKNNN